MGHAGAGLLGSGSPIDGSPERVLEDHRRTLDFTAHLKRVADDGAWWARFASHLAGALDFVDVKALADIIGS